MWSFLADTVGFGRAHIADWQPVWTSGALLVPWTVGAGACAAGLAEAWRTVPPTRLVTVVLLGAAAFWVSRIDAFFALAALHLVACAPFVTCAEGRQAPR